MNSWQLDEFREYYLSLLTCLSTFVKNQLTINICIFWNFNSIPLIYAYLYASPTLS